MQLVIPLLLTLVACRELPPEPAVEAAERPPPVKVERPAPDATPEVVEAPAPVVDAAPAVPAPESVAAIRPLLLAHHGDDLPDAQALSAHPEPEAALRWMAEHDELMLVRARSLDLLGSWDTDDNAAFLLSMAQDEERHDKQRTAAVLGLKRMDLAARPDVVAGLSALAGGSDARVAVEAIGVLGPVDAARPELEALAGREGLDPSVAEALAAVLR